MKFSYPSLKTLNDLFNKFTHFDIILSGTVGRIISLLSKVILGKIPSPINLIFIRDLDKSLSKKRSRYEMNSPALYGLKLT